MKKCNLKILTLTMALCVSAALSGCAANAAATQEPNKQTTTSTIPMEQAHNSGDTSSSNSTSTAEAYESDEVISPEEQAKAEEVRRAEIAEQYSIYEAYGMTYDKEKDRFFYNGQMVRYFKDQVSAENTNSFFFEDGVVDVEPIRDTNGTLTGLKQSSDADFKARTEKQEEIKAEFNAAGITGNSGSFEMGDPNYRDDSLCHQNAALLVCRWLIRAYGKAATCGGRPGICREVLDPVWTSCSLHAGQNAR